MDITKAELEEQIEKWVTEKHTLVANLNMLEGAIQAYRSLLTQIENAAVVETDAAPADEQETGNGITNSDSKKS